MITVKKSLCKCCTALLIALLMLLSFLIAAAPELSLAAEDTHSSGAPLDSLVTVDGILYSLDGDSMSAQLCFGRSTPSAVTVPESITENGAEYVVRSVSSGAFAQNPSLEAIYLPSTVTHVGSRAFFACTSLKTVCAPALSSVGTDVFTGTPFAAEGEFVTLGRVLVRYNGKAPLVNRFPEGISFVADAFSWNPYVKTVILPEGVTSIGDGAFACAEGLRTVSLPFSLEAIGSKSFFGCVSLGEISIASNVTRIGEDAFLGTPFLAELYEARGDMIILGGGVLLCYKGSSTDVSIPFGVVHVADAFAYTNVQTVTAEGNCSLGVGAFRNARDLKRITVKGDCLGIGSFAFAGCDSLNCLIFAGDLSGSVETGALAGAPRGLTAFCKNDGEGFDALSKKGLPVVSPHALTKES